MQAGRDTIAFELLISPSSPRSGLVGCLCWRGLEEEDGGREWAGNSQGWIWWVSLEIEGQQVTFWV